MVGGKGSLSSVLASILIMQIILLFVTQDFHSSVPLAYAATDNSLDQWKVSMAHTKKLTLVSVKNDGEIPFYSVVLNNPDGKIIFVKAKGWDRERLDEKTVNVYTGLTPIPKGRSLLILLLTDNHASSLFYNVKDKFGNVLADGVVFARGEQPTIEDNKMLIVLSAPSIHDPYYHDVFDQIIDFQVRYAKTIIGHDNVVVLADRDTMPYLEGKLPDNILLEANVEDIWMRDFTTVNPLNPIQFTYAPSYFDDEPQTPRSTQESFNKFASKHGVTYKHTEYILDSGNVVDNYKGKVVVTERFLEDNDLAEDEAKEVLKELYGADHVAIIPYDDEIMGHSDGMVMFVDDILFANKYEEPFRTQVLQPLKESFPDVTIVEVDAGFEIQQWKNFASACGININSLVTFENIYVPVFGNNSYDQKFLETLGKYTDKTILTVDATNVCFMGGGVRCLSWQVTGENATNLINAAANE